MTILTTRLKVSANGSIASDLPLPEGEHVASVEIVGQQAPRRSKPKFDINAFPVRELGPWPEGATFRREDIYGDDGR